MAAAVVFWPSSPAKPPELNEVPFYQAVAALANQPVVHYAGNQAAGTTSWDIKATAGGEQLGTITIAGQQMAILKVGDRTYLKPPQSLLGGSSKGSSATSLQGRWITGDDRLTALLPQDLSAPPELARSLWQDLAATTAFPLPGAPTSTVDGVTALEVTTPGGVLDVSAGAPYRVLRFTPTPGGGASTGGTPGGDPGTGSGSPSVAPADWSDRTLTGAVPAADSSGQHSFSPMSPSDVGQLYSDLIDQTKQLAQAVDVGISFDFNQTGNLQCSEASCTVTENVSSSTTSRRPANLSGTVTATMTATLTVNGQAAGNCTQTAALPINGSGTLSCVDPGIAPVVQQIKAQKQAEADAEAKATGHSVRIPYTLNNEASVQIEARAQVQAEVDKAVQAEQAEQDTAKQNPPPPASSAPCPAALGDGRATGTRVTPARWAPTPAGQARPGAADAPQVVPAGDKDPLTFFGGYTGRVDQFTSATGRASFEIHVYYKGKEYGLYGPAGWFPKHGLNVPRNPPPQLESVLKGYSVDWMRRAGVIKPGDTIKGDDWKRPGLTQGTDC
ncbi:hypothetical protein [Kitasatospora sp. NPDC089509]|uniref:hypothetical protein n=1 Tax=Kitasatospora sp. NPDC089509 TaxID=3364079 RepID=UPI0038071928